MFKRLIDKLQIKKQQLQKLNTHNKNIENKVNEKEKQFDIIITKQDNISYIVVWAALLSTLSGLDVYNLSFIISK